jgi:hypothetical protein
MNNSNLLDYGAKLLHFYQLTHKKRRFPKKSSFILIYVNF